MNPNKQSEKRIKEKLQLQGNRYTVAIREGNFADAKAIRNAINQLQLDMDKLRPYSSAGVKDTAIVN
jgi:hypothetical protein